MFQHLDRYVTGARLEITAVCPQPNKSLKFEDTSFLRAHSSSLFCFFLNTSFFSITLEIDSKLIADVEYIFNSQKRNTDEVFK